jgi:hypothetical protein
MRITHLRRLLTVGSILGLLCSTLPASAFDVEPANYIPFPAGTDLVFGYYQYFSSDRFIADNGNRVPDSEITANLGIVRDNYYDEIAGMPYCVHFILPFGSIDSARVGGEPLNTKNGVGDLITGVTLWPIHNSDPEFGTDLGVSAFAVLPTGEFNPTGPSLGSGAVSVDPEVGIVQHLSHGFMLSSILDARFQSNHTDAGERFETRASYQAQLYFGYAVTPNMNVWAGYSGEYGGSSFIDQVYTGQKTRSDDIRMYIEGFATHNWHLQLMVASDVTAIGGFQRDIYTQIRVVRAFWPQGGEH